MREEKSSSEMILVERTGASPAAAARQAGFELVLTLALSVSCWFTFFSMFPDPAPRGISIALILGMPALLYGISRSRLLGRFLIVYVFLFTAVLFALAYDAVWNGFLVMGNIIVEVVNRQWESGWIPFALAGTPEDWALDTLLAQFPAITVVSAGIAYSVYHKEPLAAMILTAIPVLTGLCLRIRPSLPLLLLIAASWAVLISLSAVSSSVSEDRLLFGRKKRRPIRLQTGDRSPVPLLLSGSMMVLLLAFVLIFSGGDYRPPEKVDQVKAAVVNTADHLRFDRLTGEKTRALPEGDLRENRPMEYTEAQTLQVTMRTAQPMHLRGFIGGWYEDGHWERAPEGAYAGDYLGITEWLKQQDFIPWLQGGAIGRMNGGVPFEVSVVNTGASSRYIYMPYETAPEEDAAPDKADYRKDFGCFASGIRGQRSYRFRAYPSDIWDYSEGQLGELRQAVRKSPDWPAYADAEAVYRKFVYETYLPMEEDAARLVESAGIESCDEKSIEYTLNYIRRMFEKDYTRDLQAEQAPDGEDPLACFLSRSHAGNDMLFATAAALMFRHTGVPARYAEGYYIPPEETQDYEGMKDAQITVPDSMNHAWVEIYIDELGWFPVEVVPGFYELEKTVSAQTEQAEKTEETPQTAAHDEAPLEQEAKQAETEGRASALPLLAFILGLLAAAAVWIWVGKRKVRRRWIRFREDISERTAFEIYRYTTSVLAFGGCHVGADPEEATEEVRRRFPGRISDGWIPFIETAQRIRFSGKALTENDQLVMAQYAQSAAEEIRRSQSRWGRFKMGVICRLV